MFEYFEEHFGYNANQTTALMGAHAVGNMRRSKSGYTGQFTEGRNRKLNNDYYADMFDSAYTWSQEEIVRTEKWQYAGIDADSNQVGIRLHTDFELLYKVTLNDDDSASCILNQCELADTYDLAAEYASVRNVKFSDVSKELTDSLHRIMINGPLTLLQFSKN